MGKKWLIGLICLGFILTGGKVYGQQVDPFYTKLMAQGERSFLEGRFQDAVEELKVAVFGLGEDKTLKGKAHVYMGLAHYRLKNTEECERELRLAESMFGEEGYNNLEIDQAWRREMEEVLGYFQIAGRTGESQLGLPEAPEREVVPEKVVPEKEEVQDIRDRSVQPAKDPVERLEDQIKAKPQETSAYYELYDLYREKEEASKARKTLEKLVKKNPFEINGFYMLGLIHYQARKYNDAMKNFTKISELATRVDVEEETRMQALAYLILSTHLKGDREEAVDIASQSEPLLTEDRINALDLKTGERARLVRIMEDGRLEGEAKRLESRIKSLQNRIKAMPQEVGRYYELYEIYRDLKDTEEAKKTIQNLLKRNPYEMEGHFLLAKLEYRERQYKGVLKSCRKILEAPDTARVEHSMILKATVYATIALNRLGKQKDTEDYLQYLQRNVSSGELEEILKEEGLEREWARIDSEASETSEKGETT